MGGWGFLFMQSRIRIYVGALVLIALIASAFVYRMEMDVTLALFRAAAVYAVLSAVCEMMAYKKAGGSESGSIAFLPTLASVIVAPNWITVAAVTMATIVVQIARRRIFIKAVFNVAQVSVWVSLAILGV